MHLNFRKMEKEASMSALMETIKGRKEGLEKNKERIRKAFSKPSAPYITKSGEEGLKEWRVPSYSTHHPKLMEYTRKITKLYEDQTDKTGRNIERFASGDIPKTERDEIDESVQMDMDIWIKEVEKDPKIFDMKYAPFEEHYVSFGDLEKVKWDMLEQHQRPRPDDEDVPLFTTYDDYTEDIQEDYYDREMLFKPSGTTIDEGADRNVSKLKFEEGQDKTEVGYTAVREAERDIGKFIRKLDRKEKKEMRQLAVDGEAMFSDYRWEMPEDHEDRTKELEREQGILRSKTKIERGRRLKTLKARVDAEETARQLLEKDKAKVRAYIDFSNYGLPHLNAAFDPSPLIFQTAEEEEEARPPSPAFGPDPFRIPTQKLTTKEKSLYDVVNEDIEDMERMEKEDKRKRKEARKLKREKKAEKVALALAGNVSLAAMSKPLSKGDKFLQLLQS